MAEFSCNADAGQLPRLIDLPFHTDDGIEPQQFSGDRWISQIDLSGTKGGDDLARQRPHVYLQANRQRSRRIDPRNGLVHAKHVRPQLFVAEGVVSEDHLAVAMCSLAIVLVLPVAIASVPARSLFCGRRLADARDDERQHESEYGRRYADESHRCSLLHLSLWPTHTASPRSRKSSVATSGRAVSDLDHRRRGDIFSRRDWRSRAYGPGELLRALQEREIRRAGAERTIKLDARSEGLAPQDGLETAGLRSTEPP